MRTVAVNTKGFDIQAALLETGRREFLAHGFEGASLRVICRKVGVTTGAFYSYFERKEDLFAALVEPTLERFRMFSSDLLQHAALDMESGGEKELEVVAFLCEQRDAFKLLFDCSAGTRFAGFKRRWVEQVLMDSYQNSLEQRVQGTVDSALVRLLVKMKLAQYNEFIYGDYSADQARDLTSKLMLYSDSGFPALVGALKNNGTE